MPAQNRRPSAIDKVGTALVLPADVILYRQGEAADSPLYYPDSGGEGAHKSTATAVLQCAVVRVAKPAVQCLLQRS